jgi:hypothetical protein
MADLVHLERIDEEGTVTGEAWIVPERTGDLLCIPIWRIAADDPRAGGADAAPEADLPAPGDDDDAEARGARRTPRHPASR